MDLSALSTDPQAQALLLFLGQRFDEAERIARAAHAADPGPWRASASTREDSGLRTGQGSGMVFAADGEPLWDCEGTSILCMTAASSVHTAHHHPQQMLADVAAKRRIVALHAPVVLRGGAGARYFDTTTVCRSCEPPQFPEHAFPCPTLRLLALPYADRLGYKPEWAPPPC